MTPYWYAIVSESCPAINTTRKTEPEAASLAGKLREDYPDVEVVPMWRDAGARAGDGNAPDLTDEQIDAIAKPFIRELGGGMWHSGDDGIKDNSDLYEFARALLAAAPAAAPAEPVAWRWKPSDVFGDYVVTEHKGRADDARDHGMTVEPLYAAAPAVSAPAASDDTKRLDWLAERLLGADWAYGEPSTCVWLIETDAGISADLRASIDAAMGVPPSPATVAPAEGGA